MGSDMPSQYHSTAGAGCYGQVAVVPVRVGSPPRPQVTAHALPVQPVTVQPVAGRVTFQSAEPPHSTLHELACEHSTWQSPLCEQVAVTLVPGEPSMWQSGAPSAQVCEQASSGVHTQ